jgi:hypothetical protein
LLSHAAPSRQTLKNRETRRLGKKGNTVNLRGCDFAESVARVRRLRESTKVIAVVVGNDQVIDLREARVFSGGQIRSASRTAKPSGASAAGLEPWRGFCPNLQSSRLTDARLLVVTSPPVGSYKKEASS